MMNKVLLPLMLLILLTLSGCGGLKRILVTEEKKTVFMPSEALWVCPDILDPPSGEYTQAEVSDYIIYLYGTYLVCDESLDNIKKSLEEAKKITEEGNE